MVGLIVHLCTTPVKMEIVATLCELGTFAHTHCSRVNGKCVAIKKDADSISRSTRKNADGFTTI